MHDSYKYKILHVVYKYINPKHFLNSMNTLDFSVSTVFEIFTLLIEDVTGTDCFPHHELFYDYYFPKIHQMKSKYGLIFQVIGC